MQCYIKKKEVNISIYLYSPVAFRPVMSQLWENTHDLDLLLFSV